MFVTTAYANKLVQITVRPDVDRAQLQPITLRFAVNRLGNAGSSFGIEAPRSQYVITPIENDKPEQLPQPMWAEQPIELVPAYVLVYTPQQAPDGAFGGTITVRWRKNFHTTSQQAATLTVEHQPGAYRVEPKLRTQLQPTRNAEPAKHRR
jgi:hypothetical protein